MHAERDVPNLRVERFLDPVTGEATVHYLWKDRLVPKVRLGGKAAEQASGLSLIQKDLAVSKQWMEQARSITEQALGTVETGTKYVYAQDRGLYNTVKALFVASLAFYAKAFTEAAGRKAQMQRDWLDEEFREQHDYYMNLRHNFAAHSGDLKVEYADSYLLLVPETKRQTALQLATNRVQPDLINTREEGETFVALVDHAIVKVSARYNQAAHALMDAASTKTHTFWVIASSSAQPVDMDPIIASIRKKKPRR